MTECRPRASVVHLSSWVTPGVLRRNTRRLFFDRPLVSHLTSRYFPWVQRSITHSADRREAELERQVKAAKAEQEADQEAEQEAEAVQAAAKSAELEVGASGVEEMKAAEVEAEDQEAKDTAAAEVKAEEGVQAALAAFRSAEERPKVEAAGVAAAEREKADPEVSAQPEEKREAKAGAAAERNKARHEEVATRASAAPEAQREAERQVEGSGGRE